MKKALLLLVIVLCFCTIGCKTNTQQMPDVDSLSELPEKVQSTLDSNTFSTKTTFVFNAPPISKNVAVAACGRIETRDLKVKYKYTYCSPPDPCLICALSKYDPKIEYNKLSAWNGVKFTTPYLCSTSEGPWDATITSHRSCYSNTFTTLTIKTGNQLKTFTWSGGIETIPDGVEVVSCTLKSIINYPCGESANCGPNSTGTQNCN